MDSEQTQASNWERARELFLELADADESSRSERLAQLAESDPALYRTVRGLLAHDVSTDVGVGRNEPHEFGPYRTVELLATGGMGEVYLAERSDGEFERQVAIKRLRPGAASEELMQRFARERQTLAELEHPYIARLLDGGKTEDGQPYIVLEYVEGEHIGDYCRERGLEPRSRIELFLKVLDAVQFAHEHGVVHRDLKPGNILVREDGTPRLLDFGIARSSVAGATVLTGTGQRLFTPRYASPEQVRSETATEKSDLFALGVILYELLADVGPWGDKLSLHLLERRILAGDPPAPSRRCTDRLRRTLRGDLDSIVLRCLEVEPESRFESVAALATDLERYLAGLPILTRATRPWVRAVRMARRNPWAAAAWVAVTASIVGFGLAWRAEQTAEERASGLVVSLAGGLEHARVLVSSDRVAEAVDELRGILDQLDKLPTDQPELRFKASAELANQLLRLRRWEESLVIIERGLAELPDNPSEFVWSRATFLNAKITAERFLGTPEDVAKASRDAYYYAREHLTPGHQLRLDAMGAYAVGVPELSLEERIAVVRQCVAEARKHAPPRSGILGSSLNLLSTLLREQGSFEEALDCANEALEIDRWHHGDRHSAVALSRRLRGDILKAMKRWPEAREDFEAALPVFLDAEQLEMAAGTLRTLGETRVEQGDFDGAIEDLSEAHGIYIELLGEDSETARNLGSYLDDVERARDRFETP